mgnify:CR=1 FL=1
MTAAMADEPTEEPTEAVGGKRKARVNPGQHKCWILGCDCRFNLKTVPPDRVPDARYCLELHGGMDPTAGVAGAALRRLPLKHNKLCNAHYPDLPEQQIIGAEVLVPMESSLIEGVVQGPKPSTRRAAAGAALSAAALIREQRWLVKETAGDAVHEMSTAEVWRQAALLRANADLLKKQADGAKARRIKSLQVMLQRERARAAEKEQQPQPPSTPPPAGRSPRSLPCSPRRSSAAPPVVRRQTALIRVRVPERWRPGDSITVDVPADFVPGSAAKTIQYAPARGCYGKGRYTISDQFHARTCVFLHVNPITTHPGHCRKG